MDELASSDEYLIFHIETRTLPAEELAVLIQALDRSFTAFARGRTGRASRPRLAVRAIEHGSIDLILEAIDGWGKVVAAGQFIAPWANHIADLAKWWILGQPPKLSPADSKLAEAISNPVASGHATQINMVLNGDLVINVGPGEADQIIQALKAPRSDLPPPMKSAPLGMLDDTKLGQLESGTLTGTSLLVDDAWYARLEGLRGVLVPIHFSGGADRSLVHGKTYRFAGAPERGSRGETVGISLTSAMLLG